ncbi:MAG: hypothetical protein JO204_13055, partial [Alphaproteobacteria bacterium]|nr:hypothetical protein [Alphaproteobacteria bacterium]
YVRPFVAVATPENGGLRLLRTEYPAAHNGSSGQTGNPPPLGMFRIWNGDDWRCPWCGARDNPLFGVHLFWQCVQCAAAGRPAFNCAGDHQGWFRCACGQAYHKPTFNRMDSFAVHGQREAPPRPHFEIPPVAPRLATAAPSAPAKAGMKPVYAPPPDQVRGRLRASASSSCPPPPPPPAPRPAARLPARAAQPLRLKWKG